MYAYVRVCACVCEWHKSERRPFASASHRHIVKAADESFWRRSFSHIPPITVRSLSLPPSLSLSLSLSLVHTHAHTRTKYDFLLPSALAAPLLGQHPHLPPSPPTSHLLLWCKSLTMAAAMMMMMMCCRGNGWKVGGSAGRWAEASRWAAWEGSAEPSAPVTLILGKKGKQEADFLPRRCGSCWIIASPPPAASWGTCLVFNLAIPRPLLFFPYCQQWKRALVVLLRMKKGHQNRWQTKKF